MKHIKALLLLALCPLLLTGCWDKRELEDNTFAVLLGIDRGESGGIAVTIAFPLTQTEGGGEGGDTGGYRVMSVEASTVVEALNRFSTKLSGPLALYSVKTIVISRDLAQKDMLRQVFSSWRYAEIRSTTTVLISECAAAEFVKARVTHSPIDPLRQEELLLEQANDSAYYKPIQLLELLGALKSRSGDGVAMYGTLAPEREGGPEGPADGASLPGESPAAAQQKCQISGLAVFHGGGMAGVLNTQEAQAYSMLTQGRERVILTLPDPLDSQYDIVVGILPAGRNKTSAAIVDGAPVFQLEINLKCTVECIQSEVDYSLPAHYATLERQVQAACTDQMAQLVAKVQGEYQADILKLGEKLAHRFPTMEQWEQFAWPTQYPSAKINLTVHLKVERTGIMLP